MGRGFQLVFRADHKVRGPGLHVPHTSRPPGCPLHQGQCCRQDHHRHDQPEHHHHPQQAGVQRTGAGDWRVCCQVR